MTTEPPRPANSNKPCPICGQPADARFRPFCSTRCADLDLHRWLGGVYSVPTEETPDQPPRDED